MDTTWIVAADSSRARVLQVAGREKKLIEIEDLLNPEGRLHDREIASDALGRWGGPDRPGGNSMPGEVSPSEHAAAQFAKRIGDYLDKARNEHRYDRVCLGALRKSLDKEVQKLVAEELPKDLSWLGARDLERYFAERPALKT